MMQRDMTSFNAKCKEAVPVLLFALFVIAECLFMYTNRDATAASPKRLLLLGIVGISSSAVLYALKKAERIPLATWFAAAFAIIAIMDIIATRPLISPGEDIHFQYALSIAGVTPEGTQYALPPLSATYLYAIPSAGIVLGNLLNLDNQGLYFIGSLFSIACFGLCSYFAVRITPIGKTVFMVISLFPGTVLAASSIGYASALFSLAILQVAFCLKAFLDKQQKTTTLVTVAVLSTLLAPCKIVFAAFSLLVLAIPNKSFSSQRFAIGYKAGLMAICIATLIVTGMRWGDFHYEMGSNRPEGAYSLIDLFTNPISWILATNESLFSNLNSMLLFSISPLQADVGMFSIVQDTELALYLLLLIFAISRKTEGIMAKRSMRITSAIVLIVSILGLLIYGSVLMTPIWQEDFFIATGAFWIPLFFLLVPLASNAELPITAPSSRTIVFSAFCLDVIFYIGLVGTL